MTGNPIITQQRIAQSTTTLSNAVELIARVIDGVVGNDVADSINGNRINMNAARTMAVSRLRAKLTSGTQAV